jgi:hypothetical protein
MLELSGSNLCELKVTLQHYGTQTQASTHTHTHTYTHTHTHTHTHTGTPGITTHASRRDRTLIVIQ